jgi:hypothetical protein
MPILWRVRVTSNRRNARKAMGVARFRSLKVRAIPHENVTIEREDLITKRSGQHSLV